MPMDMLEHENFASQSSISSRGSSAILTLGDDGTNSELAQSFLVKRMEIDFAALSNTELNDANAAPSEIYVLVFHKISVDNAVDTVAEQFDARLEDRQAHWSIIWTRPFIQRERLADDADQVFSESLEPAFKTSKSFSKGFRLDKDETYQWALFNPGASAIDSMAAKWLKVRYWGVLVQ